MNLYELEVLGVEVETVSIVNSELNENMELACPPSIPSSGA
jgi:hypothetical protein